MVAQQVIKYYLICGNGVLEVKEMLEGIWQDPEGMVHRVQGPKGELKLQFKIEV